MAAQNEGPLDLYDPEVFDALVKEIDEVTSEESQPTSENASSGSEDAADESAGSEEAVVQDGKEEATAEPEAPPEETVSADPEEEPDDWAEVVGLPDAEPKTRAQKRIKQLIDLRNRQSGRMEELEQQLLELRRQAEQKAPQPTQATQQDTTWLDDFLPDDTTDDSSPKLTALEQRLAAMEREVNAGHVDSLFYRELPALGDLPHGCTVENIRYHVYLGYKGDLNEVPLLMRQRIEMQHEYNDGLRAKFREEWDAERTASGTSPAPSEATTTAPPSSPPRPESTGSRPSERKNKDKNPPQDMDEAHQIAWNELVLGGG